MKLRVIVEIEQRPAEGEQPPQMKVAVNGAFVDGSGDVAPVENPALVVAALEQAKIALLSQVPFHPPARIVRANALPPNNGSRP